MKNVWLSILYSVIFTATITVLMTSIAGDNLTGYQSMIGFGISIIIQCTSFCAAYIILEAK